MARLRLRTANDPDLLLRHAASGFLVRRPATDQDPFPTPSYLLALRQGGLRDDLIALAASEKIPGWFDPPLCTFAELPERLGVPEHRTLGTLERRVLLSRILCTNGSSVFGRLANPDDFVDAVDSLFGELISEGVAPSDFRTAIDATSDRDEFEQRRDTDLAAAYEGYHSQLEKLEKRDGRDLWLHCASALAAHPDALARALGGRREIRIFGLNDLRRGWRPLLAALAASPALDEVSIYTSVALPLGDLGAIHEPLTEPATLASALFSDDFSDDVREIGSAQILGAPDVEREMDEVARRIRLLMEGGAPAHRIAIVSRQARPHVDLAMTSLARFGVPGIARRRYGLAEIPSVRAVSGLFEAAAGLWTRAGLNEIAGHPYLHCQLDARVLDVIGYRRRVSGLANWSRALVALEHEARAREARIAAGEDEARGRPLPPSKAIAAARACFDGFAHQARTLDQSRSLSDWLDWLADFLAHDPWGIARRMKIVPLDRFDIVRRDIAGWEWLAGVITEWRGAVNELGALGEPLDVAAFNRQLQRALEGDVPLWTPPQRGVQVLEAFAAAYRAFDHVFLVGMEGGQFPATASRSPVLDEGDRESLAARGMPLDLRADWDARERDLFRVLVAGARQSLTVSYSRLDATWREVIRSAFVEELADVANVTSVAMPAHQVMVAGVPLYRDDDALAQALHGATIERERASGVPSRYDGLISRPDLMAWLAEQFGDDRLWSPSQLEEFAKCPWAYMSKRLLGLERLQDPSEDIEPSMRGNLLHDALRRFYDLAREHVGGPVFLRATDANWYKPLLDRCVTDAFTGMSGQWLGHPSLARAKQDEVLRIARGFIEWEVHVHEDMFDNKKRNAPKMIRTGVVSSELAFDDMVYEQDGVRIRYRGSVDRVEVSEGVDDRFGDARFVAAVDYKTTKYATPGGGDKKAWDEGVVLQIPLYAHALSKLYGDHEVARVEYLSLTRPEAVHQLQPYIFDRKAGHPDSDDAAQDQWQASLSHAIAHVKRARAGEFPAAPPSTCGCPSWCHGIDICRVKPAEERT